MKLIKWGFDDEQASYAEESNISANQGGGGIKTERGERPTVRFLGLAKIRPETHQRLSLSEVCTLTTDHYLYLQRSFNFSLCVPSVSVRAHQINYTQN